MAADTAHLIGPSIATLSRRGSNDFATIGTITANAVRASIRHDRTDNQLLGDIHSERGVRMNVQSVRIQKIVQEILRIVIVISTGADRKETATIVNEHHNVEHLIASRCHFAALA